MWRAGSGAWLAVAAALALPGAGAAGEAGPAGAAGAPGVAGAAGPLRLEPAGDGSYGESYTFIADLDDGGYLQVSLALTRIGALGLKGICRTVVVAPGRPASSAGARVGSGEWRADGTRLAVGPCQARVEGGETVVEASLGELAVRLAYAAEAAPGAAPGAEVTVGDGRYVTEVLLHRVPVSVRVAPAGGPPREGRGAGYADHTRTTVPPRELASRWVRFRSLRAGRPLLLLLREGMDGALAPAQACGGAGPCHAITTVSIERGALRPLSFTVRLFGPGPPLTIRSGALLYRDAPVEELGLLRHVASLFFGSPVTYVFRASADDGRDAGVEGLLEVELRDE